ncbi:uncharacterized protein RHOBADRAFT_54601, partial [Rhodotorula graminis WP1]
VDFNNDPRGRHLVHFDRPLRREHQRRPLRSEPLLVGHHRRVDRRLVHRPRPRRPPRLLPRVAQAPQAQRAAQETRGHARRGRRRDHRGREGRCGGPEEEARKGEERVRGQGVGRRPCLTSLSAFAPP